MENEVLEFNDDSVRELGFDDVEDFHARVGGTKLPLNVFKIWQREDGTRSGLDLVEKVWDGLIVEMGQSVGG